MDDATECCCPTIFNDALNMFDHDFLQLSMAIANRSGLWMLAGFLLLGWVLARMTVQRKKRAARQRGEDQEMQRRLNSTRPTALPLSDAPVELQRWQVAMFDLQRELKGELDCRIAITQNLMQQLDQRIAMLNQLQEKN